MSTDGLAALQQQREKATAKRRVPPPKHPAKPAPADAVEQAETSLPSRPASAPVAVRAAKKKTSSVLTAAAEKPAAADASGDGAVLPLRRLTFYLDEQAHEWLEDIGYAGRRAKSRVDASRSAVVRLALERLMDQMGVEAVVAELQGRAERAPDSPGRKRI